MACRPFSTAVLAAWLATAACSGASAQQSAPPVEAVWKAQQIRFYFQSFTTFYSCDALKDRLENLIAALGVEGKVTVRSADCPHNIARVPFVILDVSSPVEATPAALAERAKSASTRELAARVRRAQPGAEAQQDESAPFAAQWRQVSLSRGSFALAPGDCELIEQLRRKVLPKLAVRTVRNRTLCTPGQVTLGQPQLTVEALVKVPQQSEADVNAADDLPPL